MVRPKAWDNQNNTEEDEQSQRSHTTLSIIPIKFSNKDSVVLTKQWTHRSIQDNEKSKKIDPHKYGQHVWFFYKDTGQINGEKSHFNKWYWNNYKAYAKTKQNNLDTNLIPFKKVSSQFIRDVNLTGQTIKFLEGNKRKLYMIFVMRFQRNTKSMMHGKEKKTPINRTILELKFLLYERDS